jgi:uncharacterized protein YdeI (YjbR/CyaY-like superfamily)
MSSIVYFESAEAFRRWLEEHYATASEILVGFYKVGSGKRGTTYDEAVEQALCFGWIDGVRRGVDEERYMNRFTPRKAGSNWSRVNIARVEELKRRGLMHPAGLAAYEARREDRTAVYSFEQGEQQLPEEMVREFQANAAAWEFFQGQSPSYRRTATHWVLSAKKPETRQRRLGELIADSAAGRKIKLLRRPQ